MREKKKENIKFNSISNSISSLNGLYVKSYHSVPATIFRKTVNDNKIVTPNNRKKIYGRIIDQTAMREIQVNNHEYLVKVFLRYQEAM